MAGEITFTPSEKDYADANRDWMLSNLSRPRPWIGLVLLMLLSSGIGAGATWLDGNREEMAATAIGFALLGMLIFLVVYLATYLLLPRRARRLYRQHKALQQQWTFRWSDSELSIESANGLTRYPWAQFHRWRDGRQSMLLFLNDQLFFYLPRRMLDEASIDEIGSLVAAAGVPRR